MISKTHTLAGMLHGELGAEIEVSPGMLSALHDSGFVVIPDAVPPERMKGLVAAYDARWRQPPATMCDMAARPLE